MKYFPSWTGPLNAYAFFKNWAYNGIAGDLWTPWDIVAQYVPDLQISSTQFGMGYIAHGSAQRLFAAPSVRRLGKSRGEYEWLPEVFRCTRN